MRYIITVIEVDEEGSETPRYQQTIDQLDMQAVINAVNSPQRQKEPGRQRALRSDAGKPRKIPDTITMTVDGEVA